MTEREQQLYDEQIDACIEVDTSLEKKVKDRLKSLLVLFEDTVGKTVEKIEECWSYKTFVLYSDGTFSILDIGQGYYDEGSSIINGNIDLSDGAFYVTLGLMTQDEVDQIKKEEKDVRLARNEREEKRTYLRLKRKFEKCTLS